MNSVNFASRNTKEILRDPLTLVFSLGFPIVLLVLLSAINSSIPQGAGAFGLFEIERLAPGITVFGLSFMSLFSSMLIAKDRTTGFMMRLFTSPMKASDFILGYTVPLLPMSMVQTVICYAFSMVLGLEFSLNLILAALVNIPISLVFIALGLFFGTVLNEKAVGGVCGALLTNLSAWFSNIWFDTALVGGWFEKLADILPFAHAVNAARYAVSGDYQSIMSELWIVLAYAAGLLLVAIITFALRTKDNC